MAKNHFYESTIIDSELDISTTFIVVPYSQLPPSCLNMSSEELFRIFDIKIEKPIESGWLVHSIAQTLFKAKNQYKKSFPDTTPFQESNKLMLTNEFYKLAEYIAMSSFVPIENSPVQGKSLGEVFTDSTGVVLGTYVGYIISGLTPMLVFWIPAGMIFFGAVSGIANGLSEGLRERIKTLITTGK